MRFIDLSKPVNYLRLTAMDLTAVFNHPAINQHSVASSEPSDTSRRPAQTQAAPPPAPERPVVPHATALQPSLEPKPVEVAAPKPEVVAPAGVSGADDPGSDGGKPPVQPSRVIRPLPNLWLEGILDCPSHQRGFTCLIYTKLAQHFGNSSEGMFGPIPCWACSLGDVDDICDPAFRGVFLTQKGGLAYLNQGHIARFHNEVAFLGTLESTIEGIGVDLKAVGADSLQRIVFVVNESYRTQFGVPVQTVTEALARLGEYGALVMSAPEILHSPDPIEVLWTVPAEQEDPNDPQAAEHIRPGSDGADQSAPSN
jgi:hypothetical protein